VQTKPAFSTFFTNHVAASMHRFWAAAFPGDYQTFQYTQEWVQTYAREIEFAMSNVDAFLSQLLTFADDNPEYALWVVSSIGQAATEARLVNTQLHLADPAMFMKMLGIREEYWRPRP